MPRLRTLAPAAPEAIDRLTHSLMAKNPAERPALRDVCVELEAIAAALRLHQK